MITNIQTCEMWKYDVVHVCNNCQITLYVGESLLEPPCVLIAYRKPCMAIHLVTLNLAFTSRSLGENLSKNLKFIKSLTPCLISLVQPKYVLMAYMNLSRSSQSRISEDIFSTTHRRAKLMTIWAQ